MDSERGNVRVIFTFLEDYSGSWQRILWGWE